MKLILAPMRGLTLRHFRGAFAKHFGGVDGAVAPFIRAVPTLSDAKLLKDLLPENNAGLPVVPQLLGNRAADLLVTAEALAALGYDEVNLNLGCPHKQVLNKGRGAGLLPHPERLGPLLAELCRALPIRLSVKVRLGVADPRELLALVPILNDHPLASVTIHARTADQMYGGRVDLDSFESAYRGLVHPVCYNGDLRSVASFSAVAERFGELDRFMIGRGLVENPFLAERIRGGDEHVEEPIGRLRAFHDDLVDALMADYNNDHAVLGKLRELWTYLGAHLSNGRKIYKKVKKAHRTVTARAIVSEHLDRAEWLI